MSPRSAVDEQEGRRILSAMSSEEPTEERKKGHGIGCVVGIAVAIVLLPFVPYALAWVELHFLGSGHVGEFFGKIGLGRILAPLYNVTVFRWFPPVLRLFPP